MKTAISEKKNSLSVPFAKPVPIKTLEWLSTQLASETIYTFTFPDVLVSLPDQPITGLLELYYLFRTGFKITARLNSQKMQQGRLIMAWVPMDVALDQTEFLGMDMYALQNYPHVKLDAATSTVAELNIAFESIQSMLTTNTGNTFDSLGKVFVCVLNPLSTKLAAGATTSADISFFVTAQDDELRLVGLRHTAQIPTFRRDEMLDDPRYQLTTDQWSKLSISREMDMIQTIFEEGKATISDIEQGHFGSVLHRAGDALQYLGLDNPVQSEDIRRAVPLTVNPINAGVGKSQVEQLDIINNQIDVTSRVQQVSKNDDMDILSLTSRYSMFQQRSWSTSQAPGTFITSGLPVTPMLSPTTPIDEGVVICAPTFLAYNTAPFMYWSGALTFRFEFVKTNFHSGRLYIGWVPNISEVEPLALTLETAQAFPGTVVDLQECKEHTMCVPYNATTPFKFTSTDTSNQSQHYIDYTPAVNPFPTTARNCNGAIFVMVLNRLVAAGPVADSIEINFYIKAESDYKLRGRMFNFIDLPDIPFPIPPSITREMARTDTPQIQSTLIAASKEKPDAFAEFGESLTYRMSDTSPDISKSAEVHLKTLLSSYSLIHYQPTITSNLAIPCRPIRPASTSSSSRLGIISDLDVTSHFLSQFCFYRGSLNYKLIFNSSKNCQITGLVSHHVGSDLDPLDNPVVPYTAFNYSTWPYTQPFNLAFQPSVQVGVPYKVPYQRIVLSRNFINADEAPNADNLGYLAISFLTDGTGVLPTTSMMVLRALGDDAEPHFVIAPPISFQRTAPPSSKS